HRYALIRHELTRIRLHGIGRRILFVSRSILTQEPVDQAAGNAELAWQSRQLATSGEPGCLDQLVRLRMDLAAGVVSCEADHQRMRKWPRLTAEVADVPYLEIDLLAHLTSDRLFE